MDLADQKLVRAFLADFAPARRGRRVKTAPPSVEMPPPNANIKQTRCRCGQCPPCRENARWERIFNDKFLDPHYYQREAPKFGSSLNLWR